MLQDKHNINVGIITFVFPRIANPILVSGF